ncbi:MAG: class A beta-lactamase-related serine hydrolase [Acidobacteria bacterium]|nr:class A beta-lactamase-related serine hydrolase [Acidobacteriota bacterium]
MTMRVGRFAAALMLAGAVGRGQARAETQPSVAAAKAASPLAGELQHALHKRLDAIASALDGVIGYAVIDITSGESIASRLADEIFPTASTIKLAILYELFKQNDEGGLAIDRPVALGREQIVGGSGILQHLSSPALSLRDHATLMIALSDNTATNVVIDAVGMSAVAQRLQALGLSNIKLRRKMMDTKAALRGDENVASPTALARMATHLWQGEGLTEASRESARRMLRAVGGSVRSAVPSHVAVSSKTGSLDGVRAEAAVVELDGRPFALAVMTTYLKNEADGVTAIRDAASAAWDYFSRAATGGMYGRRMP